MMIDPINREDAIELLSDMLHWEHYDKATVQEAIAIIRDVAGAQPERRTGHWLVKQDRNGSTYGECSQCHSIQYAGHTPYCPYCGSKMEDKQ